LTDADSGPATVPATDDRFLSAHPRMKKIGVAFSCLEVEGVPADENDVPMDIIVTEEGVLEISPR